MYQIVKEDSKKGVDSFKKKGKHEKIGGEIQIGFWHSVWCHIIVFFIIIVVVVSTLAFTYTDISGHIVAEDAYHWQVQHARIFWIGKNWCLKLFLLIFQFRSYVVQKNSGGFFTLVL